MNLKIFLNSTEVKDKKYNDEYLVSQGRAVKAQGLEVSAPTGQMSMMLPDSSDMNIFSMYVPTCMSFPLPVVPKSSTPAISLANLRDENAPNNWSNPQNYLLSYRKDNDFQHTKKVCFQW